MIGLFQGRVRRIVSAAAAAILLALGLATPAPAISPVTRAILLTNGSAQLGPVINRAGGVYALRRLATGFSGALVNVRRDSDNAAIDVGLSGNDLDTVSLLNFVNPNYIWNSSMSGCAAGSPGTLPTGFLTVGQGFNGLNWQVTACSTDSLTIRYYGTPTGSRFFTLQMPATGTQPAGSQWTLSETITLVAGSMANISLPVMAINGAQSSVAINPTSTPTAYTTTDFPSTAGPIQAYLLRLGYTVGQPIDVTLTIDHPQLNAGVTAQAYVSAAASGLASGYVTKWYDQSPAGNTVSQAAAVSQPQLVSAGALNTINNRPALYFSNSNLQTSGAATWLSSSSYVINAVEQNTLGAPLHSYLMGTVNLSAGNDTVLHVGWRAANDWIIAQYSDDADYATSTVTAPQIFSGTKTAAGSELRFNGSLMGANSSPTGTLATNSPFVIGFANSPTYYWVGTVAEVLLFPNSISVAQRQLLEHNQETVFAIAGQ